MTTPGVATGVRRDGGHPPDAPGTQGIWTFIFIDMVIFALLFAVYLSENFRLPAIFAASRHHLEPLVGLASALLLLTSSWCMVEAVHATRRGAARATGRWLNAALLLGGLFVVNKLVEYAGKFAAGIGPTANSFFTFYFVITGLHLTHVLGCMAFMSHCRSYAARELGGLTYVKKIENVGLFWHFVDVLWLFIFPMLYLAGIR